MAVSWHNFNSVPAMKTVIYYVDKEFSLQRVFLMTSLCFELIARPDRGNQRWAYEKDIVNDAINGDCEEER